MLRFDIITIFPSMSDSYLKESILARAKKKKLIKITAHNLRDYTTGRHRTVDDSPYGGGAGMVMKVEPIWRAVRFLKSKVKGQRSKIILLSAKGKQFTQQMAQRYAKMTHIIFICGRYEGVDERVVKHIADEEISIGPYVLTGGELPAMVVIDAVSRHIPEVLGNAESLKEESFSPRLKIENCKLKISGSAVHEYPQYTRPEIFKPKKGVRWQAPKVLLSGDHQKIAKWRAKYRK